MSPAHWLAIVSGIVITWASFAYLSLDLTQLFSAQARVHVGKYIVSFFPPDLSSAYLRRVVEATLETIAI